MVFVRLMDVPSVEETEIEKMAYFQAIKDIPYSKEEMIISYRNLGSYRNGFSSIMLAIANRHMIQQLICKEEGVNIKVGGIRLCTELIFLALLKKDLLPRAKACLVIHIGGSASEVMIADKRRIVFTRGFKNNDKFLEEIDRSVQAYEKNRDNPEIESIVVSHASDIDIKEARPHIERHFNIPLDFHEYKEGLTETGLPAEIDFLPSEVDDKKTKTQKRQEAVVTYALVGFIVILVLASLSFKIYKKKRLLKRFSAGIAQMQGETKGLEESFEKIKIAKEHGKEGALVAEIFKRSYTLTPSDISISTLDYKGKGVFLYKGTSREASAVFEFAKKLERSRYFKKSEVKYATKRRLAGTGEITDFSIECQMDEELLEGQGLRTAAGSL